MNKLTLLVPAALVATMAPAQVTPPGSSRAPQITVAASHGRITWFTNNVYSVRISPGPGFDQPSSGSIQVAPGTYTVTAIGARGRSLTRIVTVN